MERECRGSVGRLVVRLYPRVGAFWTGRDLLYLVFSAAVLVLLLPNYTLLDSPEYRKW